MFRNQIDTIQVGLRLRRRPRGPFRNPADPREPRHQRRGGHGRRRRGPRNKPDRIGGPRRPASRPGYQAGDLPATGGEGYRRRHGPGNGKEGLRAFLHHERDEAGHGPWARRGIRHREGSSRRHHGGEHARRGFHVSGAPSWGSRGDKAGETHGAGHLEGRGEDTIRGR